jgi:hypothetical protein
MRLLIYDYSSQVYATQTILQEWHDDLFSPGGGVPLWTSIDWNADYDYVNSFSATSGHRYGIWIVIDSYCSGSTVGGYSYSLVDFDHSSYGDHDTWVQYISLSW